MSSGSVPEYSPLRKLITVCSTFNPLERNFIVMYGRLESFKELNHLVNWRVPDQVEISHPFQVLRNQLLSRVLFYTILL